MPKKFDSDLRILTTGHADEWARSLWLVLRHNSVPTKLSQVLSMTVAFHCFVADVAFVAGNERNPTATKQRNLLLAERRRH